MRIVVMLTLLLLAGSARADLPPPNPRHSGDAGAVGKQLIAAMGDAAWQRARYFRFDAIIEREGMAPFVRSHYWDRKSGRYRFDGNADEGAYRVYFNVNTRQGEVWLGGKKLTDAAKVKKWLDTAYEAYARDTTWLLVPFRIFDSAAVALEYEDWGRGASGLCDILRIDVGREHYSMCVDQKSHLVVEWYLDSRLGEHARDATWIWSDWHKYGPLLLSTVRTHATEKRALRFDKITVSETPDEAALTPPK